VSDIPPTGHLRVRKPNRRPFDEVVPSRTLVTPPGRNGQAPAEDGGEAGCRVNRSPPASALLKVELGLKSRRFRRGSLFSAFGAGRATWSDVGLLFQAGEFPAASSGPAESTISGSTNLVDEAGGQAVRRRRFWPALRPADTPTASGAVS